MRMTTLRILLLVAITFAPSIAFSDVVPVTEDFDSVTVPALPAGWTSTSALGSQNAVTSATSSDSSPNSAFIPAPAITSDTRLTSKTYTFSTGLPNYGLSISFKHKRGMENDWDGGVFEVSINGAPFVDILDPSIGGVFNSGAYTSTLFAGGPLAGRKAWTGTSASFEDVDIRIPSIPDNVSLQFRFRVGTDTSVGGPGWFIDSFSLEPDVNLITLVTPLSPEIAPGTSFPVDFALGNTSSLGATTGLTYLSTPASILKSVTISRSGFLYRFGKALAYLTSTDPTPALTTDVFPLVVQDIPGRSAAKMTFVTSGTPGYQGVQGAVDFLSSSPAISGGILSGDVVFGSIDPCAPPAVVLPTPETGKIVVYLGVGSCSIGQAALAYQTRGAIAYVTQAPPPVISPAPGDYPSPFVDEAPTPGLAIPTFTFDVISFGPLLGAIGAPGTSTATLQGANSSELRTIAINAMNLGSDSKLGDSYTTALVNVVTDADGDGTPDYRDGCKLDRAKVAPGACGCGIADVDANANGIFDCFTAQDLSAQIAAATSSFKTQIVSLQGLLKKLSLKSKKYKLQKTQISDLKKAIVTYGINNSGSVSVSSVGVDIPKLVKKVDKSVSAVLKASSTSMLTSARKNANKDITNLLNGIA